MQLLVAVNEELVKSESSYRLHYRTKFQGLTVSIENRKGSVRRGQDRNGHEWETKMHYAYGRLPYTMGVDGEAVDVYLGPNRHSDAVYIVHQNCPSTGKFDEDKVMLGFNTADDAKEAYLGQYDDPKFFGSMTEMSFDEFRSKLRSRKGQLIKSVDSADPDITKSLEPALYIDLEKSTVKAHSRVVNGKVVPVKEYTNKVVKQAVLTHTTAVADELAPIPQQRLQTEHFAMTKDLGLELTDHADRPSNYLKSDTCVKLAKALVQDPDFVAWHDDPANEKAIDSMHAGSAFYHARQYLDESELNNSGALTEFAFLFSSVILQVWAETSGDHNVMSICMQKAAEQELSIPNTRMWQEQSTIDDALTESGKLVPLMRICLRNMYRQTQEHYDIRTGGADKVPLFRGCCWTRSEKLPDNVFAPAHTKFADMMTLNWVGLSEDDVQLQPINSFASQYGIAHMFATNGHTKMIMSSPVAKERILSTAGTGLGCNDESEAVVMGGDLPAVMFTWTSAEANTIQMRQEMDEVDVEVALRMAMAGAKKFLPHGVPTHMEIREGELSLFPSEGAKMVSYTYRDFQFTDPDLYATIEKVRNDQDLGKIPRGNTSAAPIYALFATQDDMDALRFQAKTLNEVADQLDKYRRDLPNDLTILRQRDTDPAELRNTAMDIKDLCNQVDIIGLQRTDDPDREVHADARAHRLWHDDYNNAMSTKKELEKIIDAIYLDGGDMPDPGSPEEKRNNKLNKQWKSIQKRLDDLGNHNPNDLRRYKEIVAKGLDDKTSGKMARAIVEIKRRYYDLG